MGKPAARAPPRRQRGRRPSLRVLRTSPRKLNLVAQAIRGKTGRVGAGRADLFPRAASRSDVKKVLQAAIANAENNHQLDVDRLFVKEATVGRAFVLKRFHARGRGRSARIEKHFAHLTVVVRERDGARPRGLMGQKVNPIGLRLGINRTWDSRWFARKDYANLLLEDLELRKFLTQPPGPGGRLPHRHRARREEDADHDAFGASRRRHRQEGRRHREAAHRHRQDDRERGQPQHRRDPQARDRRQADRRRHRPAARAPRRLPPRDEAGGAVGDAAGRPGHPDQLLRPARRRRDRPHGVVSRRPGAAAHACAPMSISATAPPRPPTAPAASRCGCSRARSWRTTRWRRTSGAAEGQGPPASHERGRREAFA